MLSHTGNTGVTLVDPYVALGIPHNDNQLPSYEYGTMNPSAKNDGSSSSGGSSEKLNHSMPSQADGAPPVLLQGDPFNLNPNVIGVDIGYHDKIKSKNSQLDTRSTPKHSSAQVCYVQLGFNLVH